MTRCPRSLTSRVMIFVAMAISISLLALGSFLQNAIEQHFIEQDADELQVVAQAVTKVLTSDRLSATTLSSNLARAVSGHHGIYFEVATANNILYTSPGANLDILRQQTKPVTRISRQDLYTWNVQDKHYRGCRILVSSAATNYSVSVATEINFHLHFLEGFNRTLWLIMAIAGAVTLLAAWLGVRQGLLPLRELSQHIRDIQADRLQTRLDIHCVPVELKELVVSFNQMIGQLEEGFARLSNFSDDIAHELRTPLTNLIGQTQVALTTPRSPDEYRELLLSNLEEQERLSKMVSDMLWLAQTERGLIKPVFARLQLKEEIQLLFDFFDAWASDRHITLTLSGTAPPIAGDRSMLRRAFSNLIANAIRHTPMHGSITVCFHTELHAVRIEIMNTGSSIPPEHIDRIFDRFYRIDPARQRKDEGAGLGLAIVKSIVQVHEGSICATSDKSHTTFTIILPLYKPG